MRLPLDQLSMTGARTLPGVFSHSSHSSVPSEDGSTVLNEISRTNVERAVIHDAEQAPTVNPAALSSLSEYLRPTDWEKDRSYAVPFLTRSRLSTADDAARCTPHGHRGSKKKRALHGPQRSPAARGRAPGADGSSFSPANGIAATGGSSSTSGAGRPKLGERGSVTDGAGSGSWRAVILPGPGSQAGSSWQAGLHLAPTSRLHQLLREPSTTSQSQQRLPPSGLPLQHRPCKGGTGVPSSI